VRRVFVGRWEWAAAVAAAPVLAVTAVAVAAGVWSGTATHGTGVGFGARTRAALALLVQGLGGSLSLTDTYSSYSSYPSDYAGDSGTYSYDDGTITGSGGGTGDGSSTQTYSFVPLTVTVLWIGVLVLVLLALRKRLTGPEAAVRVALVGAAGALVLALVGRPAVGEFDIGSGPVPVTVWTFLISLATALCMDDPNGHAECFVQVCGVSSSTRRRPTCCSITSPASPGSRPG